ncbi:MAG: hypothetical protein QME71_02065 [Dehalococcoidia bacterium]|nr:hypothetical protein [Dehalococcoidia bacterium]
MNLTEMRTMVRRDLHDEDPADYRWSDDELDRHIARALRELSLAIPLEAMATLTAAPDSRDVSLASLADRVCVEAVEYPVGEYPPAYVGFSLWGDTLTLLVDSPPLAAHDVNVFYGKLHTLDESGSTLPPKLEEIVATGAVAYAALEWASFAVNRINVGGSDVWRSYHLLGQERLSAFAAALARHGRRSGVRSRRLYSAARALESQTDFAGS